MRASSGTVPPTAWARQRERSNLWAMRVMRWIAVTAGRRVARLMLHPIVCGYCLGRATRQHSARYLARALGRPATWGDVYTHLFTFSAMVLDRVYLLQERFDEFTFSASGVEAMHRRLAEGRGVLAFGAHLGSFEALRMIGHGRGLPVAMIMYEDNARLINETLAALAPRAKLHTIGLGRVDAMLAIRRWLDEGGIAGLLADRTLPGNSQRSKSIVVAVPRRPGGLFRRPVPARGDPAPEGHLHGGPVPRRARLRPALHRDRRLRRQRPKHRRQAAATWRSARRSSVTSRRSRACAARRRTTGSISTTSGPMPMHRPPMPHRADLRRHAGAARRAWLVAATSLALACAVADAAPALDLGALMTLLGTVRSGEATFVETRRVEMLDRTLMASGRLSFRAPDQFVRETLKPRHEKLAVDGNTLTMSLGERSRTMQLDASPEAAVIIEAVRGTLTGNRAALERLFEATVAGLGRALDARAGAARPAPARPGAVGSPLGPRSDRPRGPGAARRRRPLGDDDRARRRRANALSRCPGTLRSAGAPR